MTSVAIGRVKKINGKRQENSVPVKRDVYKFIFYKSVSIEVII